MVALAHSISMHRCGASAQQQQGQPLQRAADDHHAAGEHVLALVHPPKPATLLQTHEAGAMLLA
jgi:hypothetical protein